MTNDVRAQEKIVDIGPETQSLWRDAIAKTPFVLWNGPVGIYEDSYTEGTDAIADAIASSGAAALIGGGDTHAAVKKVMFNPKKVFISTGGGAMLEFLADGTLPGIAVLRKDSNSV